MIQGKLYLDDPDDLSELSSASNRLIRQLLLIDFARRYYKRRSDKTALRRAEELRKNIRRIYEMQSTLIESLIPDEIIDAKCKLCADHLK